VTTSYLGANTILKAIYPDNYFRDRPYVTIKTGVDQTIQIKSFSVNSINEYKMTSQVPWLKKRPEWKLNDPAVSGGSATKFEWESDNRDVYFHCSSNTDWPIKH